MWSLKDAGDRPISAADLGPLTTHAVHACFTCVRGRGGDARLAASARCGPLLLCGRLHAALLADRQLFDGVQNVGQGRAICLIPRRSALFIAGVVCCKGLQDAYHRFTQTHTQVVVYLVTYQ